MGGSSGGGSSGGGGGSSGAVNYPGYMKEKHGEWLNAVDGILTTMTNPYVGLGTPDVTPIGGVSSGTLADFLLAVSSYNPYATGTYDAAKTAAADFAIQPMNQVEWTASDGANLTSIVSGIGDVIDEQIETDITAKFEAGMRDIGAAYTSSFVLGRAQIAARKNREITAAAERIYGARADTFDKLVFEARRENTRQTIETFYKTLSIFHDRALKELPYKEAAATTELNTETAIFEALLQKSDKQIVYDAKEETFILDQYIQAGNMMASIGGGTVGRTAANEPSQSAKAVSGVLSGAAAGTMVAGPGLGTAVGAGLGLAGSFL